MSVPTGQQFVLETSTASGDIARRSPRSRPASAPSASTASTSCRRSRKTSRRRRAPASCWSRGRTGSATACGATTASTTASRSPSPSATTPSTASCATPSTPRSPASATRSPSRRDLPAARLPVPARHRGALRARRRWVRVTHFVENLGADPAPVAIGTHPFLKIGGVPTEDLTLRLDAASHIEVDDRLLPTGEVPSTAPSGTSARAAGSATSNSTTRSASWRARTARSCTR